MGTTTFSGPIQAGTIRDTTGTTVGTNVANIGQVLMSQSQRITQAGTNVSPNGVFSTSIVIPANSTVTSIKLYVDAVWDGVASTLGVGTSTSATFFTAAGAVAGGTLGIISATAGADATRVDNWIDVGTTDVRVVITSTNTGAGTGAIVVEYIQNTNLL
jgi:hypothetical protein